MRGTHAPPLGTAISVVLAVSLLACGEDDNGSTTSEAATLPETGPSDAATVATVTGPLIHLVVLGDAVSSTEACPTCTGFVEQYAEHLEAATGRPVEVADRSRTDTAGLLDIEEQVSGEERLREQLAGAHIVIVSVGANDVMPDAAAAGLLRKRRGGDWGCGGDMGSTVKSYSAWALATTPDCLETGRMAFLGLYDSVFATVRELRGWQPTVRIALNTYDPNLYAADYLAAGLDQQTLDRLWPWMTALYDDWNRMECGRASSNYFTCVDLYHAINGSAGDQPLGDLSIDGTHPSQAGHDRIAALLVDLDLRPGLVP